MKWQEAFVDLLVPDRVPLETAGARTTHLAIGAHPDDLEVFAYSAIAECYRHPDRWFTGVTVTDGAGSARGEAYADISEEELVAIRREEQREAARIGRYSLQVQFGLPSSTVKSASASEGLVEWLAELIAQCRPEEIIVHNPWDRHATHVALFLRCLEALRRQPDGWKPRRFLGGECWRDLDWLPEKRKVYLDVSAYPHLAQALIGLYDSQIGAGKRYDRALLGRRRAHATFSHSHDVDRFSDVSLAVDLMPLLDDPALDPGEFVAEVLREFAAEVSQAIEASS